MPEEIKSSTPIQAEPVQSASNSNVMVEDSDPSLDLALEKMFNNNPSPEVKPIEKPIEQPKEKPVESKAENVEKPNKIEDPKDALPDPEKIGDRAPKSSNEGWLTLKNNYKRAHKTISDRDQEIVKLKSSLSERGEATTKEVEDLKKQIQELTGFRAMVDIQADPDFVSKFDAPFNKNIENIKSGLMELDVKEEIVNSIDFEDPARLKHLLGLVVNNKDTYRPDQVYAYQKLKAKIEDAIDLSEKRDVNISEQKTKYKEYLENKKKESFTKTAETEGRVIKRLETVAKNIPFLNKQTPKEGATEAEIQQVDRHNQMVEGMSNKVQQVLKEMDSPEGKVNASVASVAAHYFQALVKDRDSKIASLQEELKKISNVNSETEKTKSPMGIRKSSNGNGEIKDVDSALGEFFSRRS